MEGDDEGTGSRDQEGRDPGTEVGGVRAVWRSRTNCAPRRLNYAQKTEDKSQIADCRLQRGNEWKFRQIFGPKVLINDRLDAHLY